MNRKRQEQELKKLHCPVLYLKCPIYSKKLINTLGSEEKKDLDG